MCPSILGEKNTTSTSQSATVSLSHIEESQRNKTRDTRNEGRTEGALCSQRRKQGQPILAWHLQVHGSFCDSLVREAVTPCFTHGAPSQPVRTGLGAVPGLSLPATASGSCLSSLLLPVSQLKQMVPQYAPLSLGICKAGREDGLCGIKAFFPSPPSPPLSLHASPDPCKGAGAGESRPPWGWGRRGCGRTQQVLYDNP